MKEKNVITKTTGAIPRQVDAVVRHSFIFIHSFNIFLSSVCNFIYRCREKDKSKNIKEGTEKIRISWVSCNYSSTTKIDIGRHNFCLKRMINPFSDADKEKAEGQQQCMFILDAFKIGDERNKCPCTTKEYECMIPVLYLEPGKEFIHFNSLPNN